MATKTLTYLQKKIVEIVGTNQALSLVRTDEYDDAEKSIHEVCCERDNMAWGMWAWDCVNDITFDVTKDAKAQQRPSAPPPSNPMAPINRKATPIEQIQAAMKVLLDHDKESGPVVLVLRNLHRFWAGESQSTVLLQAMQNFNRAALQKGGCHVVGLSPPGVMPPDEILPLCIVVDHELPDRAEFETVLDGVKIEDVDIPVITPSERSILTRAACGLTRGQAETAYSLGTMRFGADPEKYPYVPSILKATEEKKEEVLNVDKMMTLYKGDETFDDVGGLGALKAYLMDATDPGKRQRAKKPIRGVALVGPPGTGKSLVAKALGRARDLKCYMVDLNKCKSKWVGESESGVRRLYSRMDAMAPFVACYDEVNEQIAAGGRGDEHSTDKAILRETLEWLNDHTSDVFVIMTANNIKTMHMALLRPGRINSIWYAGLPGKEQKAHIWQICLTKYGLEAQDLPNDEGWAGAEIDTCCAEADARQISIVEAARVIVPTSVRAAQDISDLKVWAENRILDAESGDLYSQNKEPQPERTGHLTGGTLRRKLRKT